MTRALRQAIHEILRHLTTRRPRSNPRVIKRKMSNWKLKRAHHRDPARPDHTATIVAATKPSPTRRHTPDNTS
jgi:hypothetical protein